ncbi:hypothetical protein [Shewanella sp. GutDb-MelDb]|uniref:hypothetical protein n=1 Tax=Shewanella sp. GutDb-MelDb TaxID=2058316 RepID=UPI000C7B587C|nr:hypothetical protein [Shewanella sp. GutDb-MelDb]PKG56647.1 hypothetical protein CXF82_13605 [Shewanella sp. GutDb-MelDb]
MSHSEDKLEQLIAKASKTMSPERALWPDIEKQLDKPLFTQPNHWRRVAVASMVLLVAVLSTVMWDRQQLLSIETAQVEVSPLLSTLDDIRVQHQQQVALLQQSQKVNWQATEKGLPFEKGIEQLRKAALQIFETLQKSPNDKQLWQLWLWTQQRELELLQQGQQLPAVTQHQGALI